MSNEDAQAMRIDADCSRTYATTVIMRKERGMAAMRRSDETVARMHRIEGGIIPLGTRRNENVIGVPLAERMAFYSVPGVSIAVISGGEIVCARGYGVRDVDATDAATVETLFQAASISKPVTVIGALRLVEQGLLALDADVNEYLTTWKVPPARGWQPRLTLRQLVSHSAGLTVHGFPGYPRDAVRPTLVQVLNGVPPANTPPIRVDTVPGTQFRYSGGGTTIVQQLMTDVTGAAFPDLMRALVLDPLGMAASGYWQPLPESHWQAAATGHRTGGGPVAGRWHIYPEMAAAGFWTIPSDLARFAIAIQRAAAGEPGGILSQAMAREALTPQIARETGGHLGLGFMLSGSEEGRRFGHSGGNEGFRCLLTAYRDSGSGAVVMTNSDEGMPLVEEIFNAIAREFDWPEYLPGEPVAVPVAADLLDRYVGRYTLRPDVALTVTRTGDTLSVQPTGQAPLVFAPASETTFLSAVVDTKLVFVTTNTGAVTGVRFQQNGQEIIGSRS
jgi:CubicO group peptidase (beta-lactamase class C family)